jgi:hypothetical protein
MTDDLISEDEKKRLALAERGKCAVTIYIALNEDGEFGIGCEADDAGEMLDGEGGYQRSLLKLNLVLPLPKTLEVNGELPEAAGGEYEIEVRRAD